MTDRLRISHNQLQEAAADLQSAYDVLEGCKQKMLNRHTTLYGDWHGMAVGAFEGQSRYMGEGLTKSCTKFTKLADDAGQVSVVSADVDQTLASKVSIS